ncbi:hypothetical protein FRY77_34195 [Halomonas sp. MG34]|nr:hypothetical protein [Halomonas sp. MG34]
MELYHFNILKNLLPRKESTKKDLGYPDLKGAFPLSVCQSRLPTIDETAFRGGSNMIHIKKIKV